MKFLIAAILAGLALNAAGAQELGNGKAEYMNSCAVCHGPEGKGDGPLGDELLKRPSDLTRLSRRNGGEFPYWRVFAVIDGRGMVPAHGDRDMPVWGRQFLPGDVKKYGPNAGEIVTRERIRSGRLCRDVAAMKAEGANSLRTTQASKRPDMVVDEQQSAIALLLDPASYGAMGPVEAIETHISRIFLIGGRAFKMKRAVKLPYVDFSTPALRLAACEKEVELNARTAPGLYLGVRRITREADGKLVFDGAGQMVDAVIEMVRFDQSRLLDRMATAGELTPSLMTAVARMIVGYHRAAPKIHNGTGSFNLMGVLDINEAGFGTSHVFTKREIETFAGAFRTALARHSGLLDRREAAGKIRQCHGDLHLRNICLFDGEPRLFDCIEFNDQIASIDVLYDLAFLLMDLWHRGFPELANLVMNRYLDEADDEDGFVLLPFFIAVRAAVRAHVTATQVEEGSADSGKLAAEARSYFELARTFLQQTPPRLVAIGGLSGSGKTTIAEALAAHVGAPPGARIVESDRIRKAMHGVPAETRLPDNAYRPDVSDRVYNEMTWRAGLILSEGGSVVADAVFDRPADRERIEKAARDRGIPFFGFWLEADPLVLWQRVSERKGGPSDATVDILSRQLQRKAGQASWRRTDSDRKPVDIAAELRRCWQRDASETLRTAS